MRTSELKKIEKELRKNDMVGITFNPTLEECDYLLSKGYSVTKSYSVRSIISEEINCLIEAVDICA